MKRSQGKSCCKAELPACAQAIHWLTAMTAKAEGQIQCCKRLESEFMNIVICVCISPKAGILACAFATLDLKIPNVYASFELISPDEFNFRTLSECLCGS